MECVHWTKGGVLGRAGQTPCPPMPWHTSVREKEGFHGRQCLSSDNQILEDEENNTSLSILTWIRVYPLSLITTLNKVNGNVMAQSL